MRRKAGFTLIELLVVIAIMAILMGLILPGVQRCRELARRATCRQNLQYIGYALHSYYDSHEAFPAGVVNQNRPIQNSPTGYDHGWIVSILPFMDEKLLANAIDPELSIYDKSLTDARKVVVPSLLCPSDTGPERSFSELGSVALSNYVGNHHEVSSGIDFNNHGVLVLNKRLRFEDISDGSTSTIIVGEALRNANDLGWASGTKATLRNGGLPINKTPEGSRYYNDPAAQPTYPEPLEESSENYGPSTAAGYGDGSFPEADYAAGYGYEGQADNQETPSKPTRRPPMVERPVNYGTDPGGFGSRHDTGTQFLMCDGAVKFLSESIDLHVYRHLLNRRDGLAELEQEF